MARTQKPTWRSVRLGQDLRRLREKAKLGSLEVAEQLGWDRSKVSRIETAKVYVTPADCEAMLDLYGVNTPTKTSLLKLAEEASKRGWWTAYGDVFGGSYVDMEDLAIEIDDWETYVVPGVLQTPEYARKLLRGGLPEAPEEEIERRLRARMARKPLLHREKPPKVHVVLDESVFRRMQSDHDIFAGQVRALLDAPANVIVQVLPYTARWTAGTEGPCVVLKFDKQLSPPKAYVDSAGGDVYIESVEGVQRCTFVFDAVSKAAMPPEETAKWLGRLLKEQAK